jgi:hypothetical protein
MKEVEGMGPEGKRYLKDKLQGKKYEGELKDEYKDDLDKELDGMSEKGKEDLKKLLGIDDDPWKDVKKELNKKKDKDEEGEESIGELMAYSEEGYKDGGKVDIDKYGPGPMDEKRKKKSSGMGGYVKAPDHVDPEYEWEKEKAERRKRNPKAAKAGKFKSDLDDLRSRRDLDKLRQIKAKDKKDWIQGAVKKPGALRAEAKKEDLIKGDEKLSAADLKKLGAKAKKSKNALLMKRVNLAKVFAKMRKKK